MFNGEKMNCHYQYMYVCALGRSKIFIGTFKSVECVYTQQYVDISLLWYKLFLYYLYFIASVVCSIRCSPRFGVLNLAIFTTSWRSYFYHE